MTKKEQSRMSVSNSRKTRNVSNIVVYSITTKDIENEVSQEEVQSNGNNTENDNSSRSSSRSNREIVVSACINLPFHADIAFDAFSDLPRQPSWSSWLHSVSYIDDDNINPKSRRNTKDEEKHQSIIEQEEKEKRSKFLRKTANGEEKGEDRSDNASYIIDVDNLRPTKWVMGWRKVRFSWKSKVTFMERPKCIQWESISGLKNMGSIVFEETYPKHNVDGSSTIDDDEYEDKSGSDVVTKMTLTMTFIAPRIVATVMKRSDKIASFMKSNFLYPTLKNFREIVAGQDLGMDISTLDVPTMASLTTGDNSMDGGNEEDRLL